MPEMGAPLELTPGNIDPRERQATAGALATALGATMVSVQLKDVSWLAGLDVTRPCHDELARHRYSDQRRLQPGNKRCFVQDLLFRHCAVLARW